jgi:hypothetical protein
MIRIDVGTASVQLDPISEQRRVDGDLDVHFLVGDLLAAVAFALTAANRPDVAAGVRELIGR